MTIRIKDILKLLRIVKIYQKNDGASLEYVKKTFNDEPIKEARLPNYLEIETFCKKLEVIKKNSTLHITERGDDLIKLNNDLDKISEKLIDFCSKSVYGDKISQFVNELYTNEESIKWYPKWAVFDLIETPELLPILYETKFLIKKDIVVQLNPLHLANFFQILKKSSKKRKITLKQLENDLKLKNQIGQIGEYIAYNFEKNRLLTSGFAKESEKVKPISQDYANAGYDISSFNGKSNNLEFDRFIEVKSSLGTEFDFHWTINEIETAKNLGEKYWIYFISKIDIQEKTTSNKPIMIQNPIKNIFKSDQYSKEPEGYHITRNSNSKE